MSRFSVWAAVPVLFAVAPLAAQTYYPQPAPPADYAASEDQGVPADDRGYAPPPQYRQQAYQQQQPYQPRYQQAPEAPPPGYYRQYRQAAQVPPPQGYAPYGYYQPEPQRRPAYADNDGGQPRAPYARYDYGRQADYYGQQPDYGRRPAYAPVPQPMPQPQRASEPQPVASAPVTPAPAPVATAPAPIASALVPSAPADPLDATTWEAARHANSAQAYTTYLDRFPAGAHAQEAETEIDKLQRDPAPEPAVAAAAASAPIKVASLPVTPAIKGLPIHAVDTAPVPVAPAAVADEAAAKPAPVAIPAVAAATPPAPMPAAFVCRPAFQGAVPYDQADAAEIAAYLQATHVNSVAAYQAYLAAYPHGTFTAEVQDLVTARQGRMSQLAAAGLAPTAAHARAKVTLTAADYPSAALRDGQQGTALASWEVAEDGCVESCKIDRSSGSAALDAATCNVITERGRYDPTVGAQGKPVRSMETAQLTWALPQH